MADGDARAVAAPVVSASASAPTTPSSLLVPLVGEWLEVLPDGAGYVSPPTGATTKRPIVVAVHGAGDRPDWSCSEWRAIFGPVPFVVCPRGTPLGDARASYAWSSVSGLEKAIEQAVDRTRARWPEHVARDAPRVYAGFSQGAMLGADVVARAPSRYPYAIFLEGMGELGPRFIGPFARDGKRALLACSRAGCAPARDAARTKLVAGRIDARVSYVGNFGHVVDGRVIAGIRSQVPWLLGDDPAWRIVRDAL